MSTLKTLLDAGYKLFVAVFLALIFMFVQNIDRKLDIVDVTVDNIHTVLTSDVTTEPSQEITDSPLICPPAKVPLTADEMVYYITTVGPYIREYPEMIEFWKYNSLQDLPELPE